MIETALAVLAGFVIVYVFRMYVRDKNHRSGNALWIWWIICSLSLVVYTFMNK